MDPFTETHEDIHSLILQHFTVDEILEITLVSKQWNDIIGNSVVCMKNIWINVGDRFAEPSKEEVKILRNSQRRYENFKISELENGLQVLLFPKRKWKRSQIDIQSFLNYREFINLLFVVNESVICLEIFDMDIQDAEIKYDDLNFPFLETLRLGFVPPLALKPFTVCCPKLEKLIIEDIVGFDSQKEIARKLLMDILRLNTNLKFLSLSCMAFVEIFSEFEVMNFKLQHLIVDFSFENYQSSIITASLCNFELFLSNQKSLSWIVICDCSDSIILSNIINQITSLDRITIDYFDIDSTKVDSKKLQLEKNFNIKQMDFDCENLSLHWLKPFLESLQSLKSIYLFHLTKGILEYILENKKTVKSIKYCSVFDKFCSDNYSVFNISIIEEKFNNFRKIT